jgi:hypothetical protein
MTASELSARPIHLRLQVRIDNVWEDRSTYRIQGAGKIALPACAAN